mmetsp:Transcript_36685/g.114552  ORF Transcript_36685/g.114552 Transcript_36685/m.114552 type:complete len:88 (-) Transcript_36685:538-801(-)
MRCDMLVGGAPQGEKASSGLTLTMMRRVHDDSLAFWRRRGPGLSSRGAEVECNGGTSDHRNRYRSDAVGSSLEPVRDSLARESRVWK